jgi:hypothetical protein
MPHVSTQADGVTRRLLLYKQGRGPGGGLTQALRTPAGGRSSRPAASQAGRGRPGRWSPQARAPRSVPGPAPRPAERGPSPAPAARRVHRPPPTVPASSIIPRCAKFIWHSTPGSPSATRNVGGRGPKPHRSEANRCNVRYGTSTPRVSVPWMFVGCNPSVTQPLIWPVPAPAAPTADHARSPFPLRADAEQRSPTFGCGAGSVQLPVHGRSFRRPADSA